MPIIIYGIIVKRTFLMDEIAKDDECPTALSAHMANIDDGVDDATRNKRAQFKSGSL